MTLDAQSSTIPRQEDATDLRALSALVAARPVTVAAAILRALRSDSDAQAVDELRELVRRLAQGVPQEDLPSWSSLTTRGVTR